MMNGKYQTIKLINNIIKNTYTYNGDDMKKLIISILIPLGLGFLTSLFINTNLYMNIAKPLLSPPKIVFPIVWTILYILLGVSNYLINKESKKEIPNLIYYIGLAINLIWPFIFFNLKEYLLALIWLIILIIFVILMLIEYYKINKKAFYLQIPYIIWLLFALYLNYEVFILNK